MARQSKKTKGRTTANSTVGGRGETSLGGKESTMSSNSSKPSTISSAGYSRQTSQPFVSDADEEERLKMENVDKQLSELERIEKASLYSKKETNAKSVLIQDPSLSRIGGGNSTEDLKNNSLFEGEEVRGKSLLINVDGDNRESEINDREMSGMRETVMVQVSSPEKGKDVIGEKKDVIVRSGKNMFADNVESVEYEDSYDDANTDADGNGKSKGSKRGISVANMNEDMKRDLDNMPEELIKKGKHTMYNKDVLFGRQHTEDDLDDEEEHGDSQLTTL